MSVRMWKNEEYKEKYLKILKDRIERFFNYEEREYFSADGSYREK